MRVTGGDFCGRTLKVPKTDAIRPTQDRVRQALFNIIQSEVAGSDFLDLFAGSGAVGIEALSRGANSATFVEASRKHVAVLKENLEMVVGRRLATCDARLSADVRQQTTNYQLPTTTCFQQDVYHWIGAYSGNGFSIGFADPPYALGEERGYASFLKTLAERNVIRPGGIFIAEMTAVQKAEETPGWELLRDRTYGKTRLCLWRRAEAGPGK